MLFDTYSCEETVRNLPFEKDGVYTHLKLNKHVHLLYKECQIKDSLVELNSRNTLSASKPLVKKVFSGGLRVDLGTKSTAVDELKKLLYLSVDDVRQYRHLEHMILRKYTLLRNFLDLITILNAWLQLLGNLSHFI